MCVARGGTDRSTRSLAHTFSRGTDRSAVRLGHMADLLIEPVSSRLAASVDISSV